MINAYCTQHKWSVMVCKAFAQGAKCPIVPPAPLLPGDIFVYGCLRGLLPTIKRAQREGRTWFYGDNGYCKPGKSEQSYFRITRNALQHTGAGEVPAGGAERWARLGIDIKPWRTTGSHVLVCPPLRLTGATWGFDADEWLRVTLATLRRHTDRELRVREKMSWQDGKPIGAVSATGYFKSALRVPMAEDLLGCWALVSHSSNSAVEALIAGVPVFNTDPCAAYAMGLSDLSRIESPVMPDDRERWVQVLASNQWLLSEMRSGLAWKMLNESAAVCA